ncbi:MULTISPECIES: ATP-dependent helicase [Campylobacter]|uniref:ATP-dependent helicase n=1 Tax=Campylobacter TaxID=194 RepID=UPI000A2FF3FE|nr:ATP-dependent helicase [Campylobacter sp. RM12175]ARR03863.1 ATP-dependent DNA helicase [Campylobacter sp. RM12175]MCR8689835.1 ATP-dependent helicase [Campylobacter sp. RM9264]MCR8700567.1 ATP-dependent helicase [Campylobacter sp. RM12176]
MPLSKLNKEQYCAATAAMGHNLIIASAGTGKTSTIVARIAHLLNSGIKADKILLLTFTNKAASEMIERLSRYFDDRVISQITAGTFHSVSNSLLKSLNKGVILKQPSELKTLLKSITDRRQFHRISDTKGYSGAYLYDIYSLFCNSCVNGEDFIGWFSLNYPDQAEFAEIYDDILQEFEETKTQFNYADFNDLLIKMRNELKKGARIYFDEILVDEYQDTNSLQGSLIDAFNTKSLFCVGDFDQSIYAFNGANIEIIGSFKQRYFDANIFSLNINYRSSAKILALANKVIANNPRLYPKSLEVSREGEFKSPVLLTYDELFSQYSSVAQLIANSKYNKNDIAIIFRNNSSADGLEVALKEQGISCKRKGGVSFFESREIKALIDLVAILVNPRDIMAFIHILEYARGVGNAHAKELFDILSSAGHGNIIKGLIDPDRNSVKLPAKKKNYQLGLFDDFSEFMPSNRFSELGFDDEFMNSPALNYSNLNQNGAIFLYELRNLLLSLDKQSNSNKIISSIMQSKIYNVIVDTLATKRATLKNGNIDNELKSSAIDRIMAKARVLLEISNRHSSIDNFYNFLTLGKSEMSEGQGVNLLTVHASKGLEFNLVFVVDLAEGRFPNSRLMSDIEEERRLFYVAVTRAKDELILSYAKYDKIRKVEYQPSCFLAEAGMVKPLI